MKLAHKFDVNIGDKVSRPDGVQGTIDDICIVNNLTYILINWEDHTAFFDLWTSKEIEEFEYVA